MSIIHDALKKAQSAGKDTGPEDQKFGKGPPLKKRYPRSVLMVVVIIVGVLALGTIVWRIGTVIRARSIMAKAVVSIPVQSEKVSVGNNAVPLKSTDGSGSGKLIEVLRNTERLLRIGDLNAAEKGFRKVLESGAGDRSELLSNLGLTLKRMGKYKEAMEMFNEALKIRPDFAEALNNRAVLFRKMKQYAEAETDLKRALELRQGYSEAQFNLAAVYEASGKKLKALDAYRSYLSNPDRDPGLVDPRVRQRISFVEAELTAAGWKNKMN